MQLPPLDLKSAAPTHTTWHPDLGSPAPRREDAKRPRGEGPFLSSAGRPTAPRSLSEPGLSGPSSFPVARHPHTRDRVIRSQKCEQSSLALCSCILVGLTVHKQVTKARNINLYCEFYKICFDGASVFLASAQSHCGFSGERGPQYVQLSLNFCSQ